jgi:hypothetical protein
MLCSRHLLAESGECLHFYALALLYSLQLNALFAAHLVNMTVGQHPATQCRLQHTISIIACVSDTAPPFQAPACLTVSMVLYHASLPWLLCAIWKHTGQRLDELVLVLHWS